MGLRLHLDFATATTVGISTLYMLYMLYILNILKYLE